MAQSYAFEAFTKIRYAGGKVKFHRHNSSCRGNSCGTSRQRRGIAPTDPLRSVRNYIPNRGAGMQSGWPHKKTRTLLEQFSECGVGADESVWPPHPLDPPLRKTERGKQERRFKSSQSEGNRILHHQQEDMRQCRWRISSLCLRCRWREGYTRRLPRLPNRR